MENQRTTELIKLNALGNLNEKDSAELLKLMQTHKDFPWKLLGDYQNLATLFAVTVKQEIPSPKLKELVLAELQKKVEKKQLVDENTLQIDDESIQIENTEETDETVTESILVSNEPVQTKKHREEALSFKDPDLSSLSIFNHSKDFEEVKSRVSKIREQLKETSHVEKQEKKSVRKETKENIEPVRENVVREPKRKSFKKVLALAASLFTVTIVVIGFMYFESSGDKLEEQTVAAKNENKQLVSNSIVKPDEQSGVVTVQNVEQLDPNATLTNENEVKTDQVEKPVNNPVINTENIETPKKESKKIDTGKKETENKDDKKVTSKEKEKIIPPLESPKIIEAPLEETNKDKTTETEPAALIENSIPPKEEKKVEEPVYFVAVEEMPEPIGGLKSIQSKITYPDLARKAGIEGKVFILAYVDENGNVTKAEVVKGIGLGCDEAALDAVLSTKFKPGKQRGKPIKVKITIPITFKF